MEPKQECLFKIAPPTNFCLAFGGAGRKTLSFKEADENYIPVRMCHKIRIPKGAMITRPQWAVKKIGKTLTGKSKYHRFRTGAMETVRTKITTYVNVNDLVTDVDGHIFVTFGTGQDYCRKSVEINDVLQPWQLTFPWGDQLWRKLEAADERQLAAISGGYVSVYDHL